MSRQRERHVKRQIAKHRPEVVAVLDGLVAESSRLDRLNTRYLRIIIALSLVTTALAGAVAYLVAL